MRRIRQSLFVSILCVLIMTSSHPRAAFSSPDAPGYVPEQVGSFNEAEEICALGDVPMPNWLADILTLWQTRKCRDALEHINQAFDNAYLRAEAELASPGFPTSEIYAWEGVLVQEFSGGELGDGFGAIIAKGSKDDNEAQKPQYVGGSTWAAYKYAIDVLGIHPGYPTSLEHNWTGSDITLQDFDGGSWGDSAIIGGGDSEYAWLVAGRHWEAYWRADGQIQLGNPVGPWYYEPNSGWYFQNFEKGEIRELDHVVIVEFYDGSEAVVLEID